MFEKFRSANIAADQPEAVKERKGLLSGVKDFFHSKLASAAQMMNSLRKRDEEQEATYDNIVDLSAYRAHKEEIAAQEAQAAQEKAAREEVQIAKIRDKVETLELTLEVEELLISDMSGVFADFLGLDENKLLSGKTPTEFVDAVLATPGDTGKKVVDIRPFLQQRGVETNYDASQDLGAERVYTDQDKWKVVAFLVHHTVKVHPLMKAELENMLARHMVTQTKMRPLEEMPNIPA